MKITTLLRVIVTKSFKPFKFSNKFSNKLDFENLNDLGLYIHIPFCRNICDFCPYCKVLYNKKLASKYVESLLKEIEMVGKSIFKKKKVSSLYFGGGTPALLIDDINIIIETIKKYFIITNGIGIELHPDDINKEVLGKLKLFGIDMISIGIQSFDENCLEKIGRKKTDFNKIFSLIKHFNFETVDVDLIFSIPGQTEKILKKDVKTAFNYGATQISTYPFIDFTFANNKYKPMSEKNKKKLLFSISKFTKQINKNRTSVWTFANKNTKKYSSITRDNFLGFGVSATTLLKKSFKINTFSIEEYENRINNNKLPTSLTINFTFRQRIAYYIFWNAYSMIFDTKKFKKYFGIELNRLFPIEILICRFLKILKKENDNYILTDKGAYYYHFIEQLYTTAYIDKMWNVSRLTPFPKEIIL